MIYLGTPGRMIKLKCPVAQRDSSDAGYRFVTTLEGKRKAQVVPGRRRVWDVSTGRLTTPDQVATLAEFASGAWGPGPFWFVPEAAAQVNLMSPHDISDPIRMSAGIPGGPLPLQDGGVAATSKLKLPGDSGHISWRNDATESDPPVLPGVPVTGSAWVTGHGAYVMLQFTLESGSIISSASSNAIDSAGVGVRVSVTATPPEGAAMVRLTVRNAERAARPAVTWTDGPMEWGEGLGCHKAVVDEVARDLVRAVPGRQMYSDTSFVVTEVG